MTPRDPHVFEDLLLGFSLRKPRSWDFLPTKSSPVQQLKNAGTEDWKCIELANEPFCFARKLHHSLDHAYPTLQVTARRSAVPTDVEAGAILDRQLGSLSKQYSDFEALQASADGVVCGYRANVILGRFTLFIVRDGNTLDLPILSRSYTIFAPDRAFVLGMSSSAHQDYFEEADFAGIISSVQIWT